MSREIKKSITVNRNIDAVFHALITPSMIKKWWFASSAIVLTEQDGTYALSWGDNEDEPDYISIAKIKEIEPPKLLHLSDFKYHSKDGMLPFEPKMDTVFVLASDGDATRLAVRQTNFPDDSIADEFYNACIKGWDDTLASLKQVLKT